MNIDRVIFQTSSEQLHFSHNSVYLYVTHPVTEHADKLYVDLKLTLKCILKGKFQNCAQFWHDLRFWNSLCDLCKVSNSVWSVSVGNVKCDCIVCCTDGRTMCVLLCVCVCVHTVHIQDVLILRYTFYCVEMCNCVLQHVHSERNLVAFHNSYVCLYRSTALWIWEFPTIIVTIVITIVHKTYLHILYFIFELL